MTKWDKDYLELCKRILTDGVEVENRTGINTIKVPSHHFHFDLGKEFPILQTKQLFFKNAITEILWIYQAQSNDVRWLHERNNHVWDEWMVDPDGIYRTYKNGNGEKILTSEKEFGKEFAHTIGTAYGWIVDRYKLTDNLLNALKNNPTDRRLIMSLWQNEWLNTAVLPSCVWSSEWDVTNGKLNAWVHQRSCDVPLGLPFNVTQYATLLSLFAKSTGLEPGTLDWSIKDAHIYVNQIDGIKEQLENENILNKFNSMSKSRLLELKSILDYVKEKNNSLSEIEEKDLKAIDIALSEEQPYLWVNPEVKDFYDYDNSKDLKDIKVKEYKHMGKIKFPIAQ
ncbi:MAG: thymidylate synthase [Bacilli bacterium]|nr:thymidylate synthase [Bacilli bacterium]